MRLSRLFLLLTLTFFVSCSNKGSTTVGNPAPSSEGQKVMVSQLVSGTSTVTIPLSVFGDTVTDVTGATVDLDVNEIRVISDLPAEDNFDSTQQSVIFDVGSLENGDDVDIFVTKNDAEKISFSARVSDTEAATANEIGLSSLSGTVTGHPMGEIQSALYFVEDDSTITLAFFDEFFTCENVPDGRPDTVNALYILSIVNSVGTYTTIDNGIDSYLGSGTYNTGTGNYDTTSLINAVDVTVVMTSVESNSFDGSFEVDFGTDGALEGTFKNVELCAAP